MKFIPQEGYIAVQVETMKKLDSGIFIPDNVLADRISRAKVVSTTNRRIETTGEYLDPVYALDDMVVYLKGNGTPLKLNGIDLIILSESEVLGKIVD